eukprot:5859776-Amphidinium_carterae.1
MDTAMRLQCDCIKEHGTHNHNHIPQDRLAQELEWGLYLRLIMEWGTVGLLFTVIPECSTL